MCVPVKLVNLDLKRWEMWWFDSAKDRRDTLPDERAGGGYHDAVRVQGRPALAVEAHVSVPPSAPGRAHLGCDARAVLAVAQR